MRAARSRALLPLVCSWPLINDYIIRLLGASFERWGLQYKNILLNSNLGLFCFVLFPVIWDLFKGEKKSLAYVLFYCTEPKLHCYLRNCIQIERTIQTGSYSINFLNHHLQISVLWILRIWKCCFQRDALEHQGKEIAPPDTCFCEEWLCYNSCDPAQVTKIPCFPHNPRLLSTIHSPHVICLKKN